MKEKAEGSLQSQRTKATVLTLHASYTKVLF